MCFNLSKSFDSNYNQKSFCISIYMTRFQISNQKILIQNLLQNVNLILNQFKIKLHILYYNKFYSYTACMCNPSVLIGMASVRERMRGLSAGKDSQTRFPTIGEALLMIIRVVFVWYTLRGYMTAGG